MSVTVPAVPETSVGLLPSPAGPHYQLADYLPPIVAVEDTIDYFPHATPIRYQAHQPECAGFATGKVLEWHNLGEYSTFLSPQWAYKLGKDRDGFDGPGTSFWAILQGCRHEGVCLEEDWPFEDRWPPSYLPGPQANENAARFKIQTYAQVTLPEIHTALAQYGPLLIGVEVYSSFYQTGDNGIVPRPSGKHEGGHGMAVMFSDLTDNIFPGGVLGGPNSWSELWGWRGRWILPRAYAAEIFMEAWSVVDIKGIPLRWSDLVDMQPDEDDMLSQDKAWQKGALHGYEGDPPLFKPKEPVTRWQVGKVLTNLGLVSKNPFEDTSDYTTPALRGWVHEKFPQLTFNQTDWDMELKRYQFLMLVGRYLRGV